MLQLLGSRLSEQATQNLEGQASVPTWQEKQDREPVKLGGLLFSQLATQSKGCNKKLGKQNGLQPEATEATTNSVCVCAWVPEANCSATPTGIPALHATHRFGPHIEQEGCCVLL